MLPESVSSAKHWPESEELVDVGVLLPEAGEEEVVVLVVEFEDPIAEAVVFERAPRGGEFDEVDVVARLHEPDHALDDRLETVGEEVRPAVDVDPEPVVAFLESGIDVEDRLFQVLVGFHLDGVDHGVADDRDSGGAVDLLGVALANEVLAVEFGRREVIDRGCGARRRCRTVRGTARCDSTTTRRSTGRR